MLLRDAGQKESYCDVKFKRVHITKMSKYKLKIEFSLSSVKPNVKWFWKILSQ